MIPGKCKTKIKETHKGSRAHNYNQTLNTQPYFELEFSPQPISNDFSVNKSQKITTSTTTDNSGSEYNALVQGCQTYGPRAKSSPRTVLLRPAR